MEAARFICLQFTYFVYYKLQESDVNVSMLCSCNSVFETKNVTGELNFISVVLCTPDVAVAKVRPVMFDCNVEASSAYTHTCMLQEWNRILVDSILVLTLYSNFLCTHGLYLYFILQSSEKGDDDLDTD